MAHNAGTPRLLAKCGSAVEVLDKQQIEDPGRVDIDGPGAGPFPDRVFALLTTSGGHLPSGLPTTNGVNLSCGGAVGG